MSPSTPEEGQAARKTRTIIAVAAAVLVAVIAVGVYAVLAFVDRERERDLQQWQVRLGIVADSRTADVNRWIASQFGSLQSLAENAALQLYMNQISLSGAATPNREAQAAAGYLRNLLNATAARDGFVPPRVEAAVDANVERAGQAGIALVDRNGTVLAATDTMPPPSPAVREAFARAAAGRQTLVDIQPGPGGSPGMAFVVPVYGVQADRGPDNSLGFAVGLRVVGNDLYERLAQPGDTAATSESYLVRRAENGIEYLSPLRDGTRPLAKRLAVDTPDLVDPVAIGKPGALLRLRDYAGDEVLATARAVSGAPWFLVRKISAAEALAESDSRRDMLLTTFILVIAGVAIAIVAVWRHGTSVRSAQALERQSIANERLENFTKFLRVVSDGQPNAVFAVSDQGRYTFANAKAAEGTGITQQEMMGKTMASVVGPVLAKLVLDINEDVIRDFKPAKKMHTFEEDGETRTVVSNHIPLRSDRDYPPGALVILQDITDAVSERAKREGAMRALVSKLVGLVDKRDPYSADQSERVAEVAVAIADEMEAGEDVRRTVDIAGNLSNIGKILVPQSVLTKSEPLTAEELDLIRESQLHTAEMIEGVAFDLPVADTLAQMHERWDGSGYPQGLAGEDILLSARIVAVANALVAIVSPRSFRDALSFDEAVAELMKQAGAVFDRRPVSALVNLLENRGGRERWAHFRDRAAR
jgi:PAS domain S-box-containing protein